MTERHQILLTVILLSLTNQWPPAFGRGSLSNANPPWNPSISISCRKKSDVRS